MTTSELIIGTFVLLSMLAICFWFGYFAGLEIATRKHKKQLLDLIKDLDEDKKNDRSNI